MTMTMIPTEVDDLTVGPNGCVVPREVRSSCCNPASNVEVEGDRCCYTWCDMACCGRPLLIGGEARLAAVDGAWPSTITRNVSPS